MSVLTEQNQILQDTGSEHVLRVTDLKVRAGNTPLVNGVSFSIGAGERVGMIGESGSGKSLTVTALIGLLSEDLTSTGSIRMTGVDHDLLGASDREMSRLRGNQITMVFQEPMTALNPTMRIQDQVAEVLTLHGRGDTRTERRNKVIELLDRVKLPEPEKIARAYPHQLSGGQRQRVVLAIALANDPLLLLCDEPTTALDVTVQAQMLDLISTGVSERGSALLFITHDLAVVATICERVLVMYGGKLVESGTVKEVFTNPQHPYTKGLIAASDLDVVDSRGRLVTIPGSVPAAGQFPAGCVFRNRCSSATDGCDQVPPWTGTPERGYACWNPCGDS